MRKSKLARLAALGAVTSLLVATVALVITATAAFAGSPTTTVTYAGGGTATRFEGDTVTIGTFPAGTFSDNALIEVVECEGNAETEQPTNDTACYGVTGNSTFHSNADGSFSGGSYRVYLVGVPGYAFAHSGGIDIDDSGADPGVLYIGQQLTDFTQPHGFADFNIGLYGRLVNNTGTTIASPGGAGVPLNAAAGAPAVDSALQTLTISGYAVTTPAPVDGAATCVAATGACTYTPNATFPGNPTTDTFGVSATGSDPVNGAVPITPAVETIPLAHPLAPTVNPTPNPAQLTSNAAGTTVAVNPQATGTDSGGNPETITAVTPSATTGGFGSTVACLAAAPFTCTYTLGAGTPSTGGIDTFTLTATADGLTSAAVTEMVDIPEPYGSGCNAVDGAAGTPPASCSLDQIVDVPVTAGDLSMAQNAGLPVDSLANTLNSAGACTGQPITLNGEPQFACGDMAPITVVNARGTDAGWDLTGQITDFIDSGKVTTTNLTPVGVTPVGAMDSSCDTVATYNNHCIPGDNAGWLPAAAVAQNIVPGDVAEVAAGANLLAPGFAAPTTPTGILSGSCGTYAAGSNAGTYYTTPNSAGAPAVASCTVQPTGATYPNYPASTVGLHSAAQSLCDSSETTATVNGENTTIPAGHAGGMFVCGAELVVAVPASAAAPTVASPYGTGYQAFLTLTLS